MTSPVRTETFPNMLYRHIYVQSETKAVEGQPGRIHAIVSTERQDRMGDIIRQDGWDLKQFKLHPVLLVNHDYNDVKAQIGEWVDMRVKDKQLEGVALYYIGEGNPDADWAYKIASRGRAAFSVGFRADMDKAVVLEGSEDSWFPNYEFKAQELLEISHVTIPANPDAVQSLRAASFHDVARMMGHRCIPAKHQSALQEAISRW